MKRFRNERNQVSSGNQLRLFLLQHTWHRKQDNEQETETFRKR